MTPEQEILLLEAVKKLQAGQNEICQALTMVNTAMKIINGRQQGLIGRVADVEANLYK